MQVYLLLSLSSILLMISSAH